MKRKGSRPAILILALLVGTLGPIACDSKPAPKAPSISKPGIAEPDAVASSVTVATVAGRPIVADSVRRELVRRGADVLDRYDELAEKEALLEDLVRVKVLAAAARREGYESDPELADAIDKLLAESYWRDHIVPETRDLEVSDASVKDYYDAHPDEFTSPERMRGSVIVMHFPPKPTEAQRAEVRAGADVMLEKLKADPTTFAALAQTHSEDLGTKPRGGDIGWIPKGARSYKWPPPLLDALFGIESDGALAPLVETDTGVYLVERTAYEPGSLKQLSEVERGIRDKLYAEESRAIQEESYAKLRSSTEIEIDRDLLAKVGPVRRVADPGSRPPAFPVGEVNP